MSGDYRMLAEGARVFRPGTYEELDARAAALLARCKKSAGKLKPALGRPSYAKASEGDLLGKSEGELLAALAEVRARKRAEAVRALAAGRSRGKGRGSELNSAVAGLLSGELARQGLSVAALARRVDCGMKSIWDSLRGRCGMSLWNLERIAAGLGCVVEVNLRPAKAEFRKNQKNGGCAGRGKR